MQIGSSGARVSVMKYNVWAVFHYAPQSMRALRKVAEAGADLIVAGHSNHVLDPYQGEAIW